MKAIDALARNVLYTAHLNEKEHGFRENRGGLTKRPQRRCASAYQERATDGTYRTHGTYVIAGVPLFGDPPREAMGLRWHTRCSGSRSLALPP